MFFRRFAIAALVCLALAAVYAPAQDATAPPRGADSSAASSAKLDAKAPVALSPAKAQEREEAILAALTKTVSVDVKEQPLKTVLDQLADKIKVQIVCDNTVLLDAGKSVDDIPVSIKLVDVSARSAFEHILSQHGLGWTTRDEVLVVSTKEDLETYVRVVVYDIADFVEPEDNDDDGVDADLLIDAITGTIATATWSELGGPGTIVSLGQRARSVLIISQTREVHEAIFQLLADLRASRGRQAQRPNTKKAARQSTEHPKPIPAEPRQRTELPQTFAPQSAAPTVSKAERRRAAETNNRFACDLYRLVAGNDQNVAFSPPCIGLVMGMVHAGAKGKTAEEIAAALRFDAKQGDLSTTLAAMQHELVAGQNSRGIVLNLANRFWSQADHPFQPSFTDLIRQSYGADVAPLDFQDADGARNSINQWFSQHTGQSIANIVPAGLVDDQTKFFLTSAVKFQGTWQNPFSARNTEKQKFLKFQGQSGVPMMNQLDETAHYAEVGGVQILELSYAKSSLGMTILLPAKGPEAFKVLASEQLSDELADWLKRLRPISVRVSLPKFQINSSLPLKECLQSLGMKRAFEPAADNDMGADFSGIDGTRDLFLKAALHQTIIDVDEVGTKAAAGTAFGGGFGGQREPPPVFRADHPFVFLIRDTQTGCILFMGHVKSP
jgi:serine protease inhibitor